jgi:hypothetical protein
MYETGSRNFELVYRETTHLKGGGSADGKTS